MKVATLVRHLYGWAGDARLYKLSAPVSYSGSFRGEGDGQTEFVVVSAVYAIGSGPETYIFPAAEDGAVINFGELEGSFRGALDHELALRDAGYKVSA